MLPTDDGEAPVGEAMNLSVEQVDVRPCGRKSAGTASCGVKFELRDEEAGGIDGSRRPVGSDM